MSPFLSTTFRSPRTGWQRSVCRLGLSSRGNTDLRPEDVHHAVEKGVDFLNWCGTPSGFSQAVAEMGSRRQDLVICAQFEARTADAASEELRGMLGQLRTDYLDILTLYYIEEKSEWGRIIAPGGSLEYLMEAERSGLVRAVGLTTHQRPLAALAARSGKLDMLMIRYNAAHLGAEKEVFPVARGLEMPIVVYTCLRWGALMQATPDDPPDFIPPRAPSWYRFALQAPEVAVALMAPSDRGELEEDLTVLDANGPLEAGENERLAEHGQRVRRHAGTFP
jgi:predicted aldo/keto reductase-like oxidoreductase